VKIAINFENLPKDGGAYHENILLSDVLNNLKNKDYKISYIVSNKEIEKLLQKRGCSTIFFKKGILYRIQNFLFKFLFFKFILKKLKFVNTFEKFIKKNNVDLLIFNNPSEVSLLAFNLLYVIVFYELQHLKYNFFPEYKSYHDFDLREIIIKNFVKNAFKIIVCVEKDKKLLEKYYNAQEDKIIIQPFVSRLPIIYNEQKKNTKYNEIFEKLNLKKERKYLFYPAQFWPHKNHKYIIDSMEFISQNSSFIDYHVIFCGYDKFNQLDYLKDLINQKKLNNRFNFFNYLEDEEIISIYLNSYALVMPTFVGHYSLPLFESFYFKLPVLFSENLLDDSLKKFVIEINTMQPENLLQKLKYINENTNKIENMKSEAFSHYNKECSLEKIEKNYQKIFTDTIYYKSLWKEN